MSWTYSGDPATSQRDELRFLIQDTDASVELLSDEEIDYLIDQWLDRYDSLLYVASVAAGAIGRKFTGVVNISADGVSVNVADISARYYEIAQRLREEYAAAQAVGSTVDISNIMADAELDDGILPLTFSRGMHDNVYAGQQDFGGTDVPYYSRDGGLAEG